MNEHERYMHECLKLAQIGAGYVAPNPMVGCVITKEGSVIGKGFHREYGKAHAEVEAIQSVENKNQLQGARLYVNLEPCSHFGKTPPCCHLIHEYGIKEVFIGSMDTNPLVGGKGMTYLSAHGIHVESGILEKECRKLNRRFFTFHEKKRPYVILKWAQTENGFISRYPVPVSRAENKITSAETDILVHQWRSEEAGIMVGSNTVKADDPQLNVRWVNGKNPVKIIFDRNLELGEVSLFKSLTKTIVVTEKDKGFYTHSSVSENIEYIRIPFNELQLKSVLYRLFEINISSVLVEGGAKLLQSFIQQNLYDEIRVLSSPKQFERGIPSPVHRAEMIEHFSVSEDQITIFRNPENTFLS